MNTQHHPRACYFDMDGTLIDSRADLATAVNATRRELGLTPLSQDVVLGFVGNGARYLLEHAIPEPFGNNSANLSENGGTLSAIREIYRKNYLRHMLDETILYPGIRTALETLAARGVLLGVNTNKPGDATRTILKHFELDALFGEAIVGGGDCAELKPSPLPLQACANRHGCEHVLSHADAMIGDNWTDLACARAAGTRAVYCRWGFGSLREATYDIALNRPAEIADLFT